VLRKEIPFLRIVPAIVSGILAGYYSRSVTLLIIITLCFSAAFLIITIFRRAREEDCIIFFAFQGILFASGAALIKTAEAEGILHDENEGIYYVELTDYPSKSGKSFQLNGIIRSAIQGSDSIYLKTGVIIRANGHGDFEGFEPGDIAGLRIKPEAVKNRGNPDEFDYKLYAKTKGIKYTAFADSSDFVAFRRNDNPELHYRALRTRQKIIHKLEMAGIEGERLGLASALLLGDKRLIEPDKKQLFVDAGVMHIMAVSGLHAGIISFAVFGLLFFLRGRLKILRVLLTLAVLWSFAYVTGLTPSVLRASLMFTFLHSGALMKRPVNQVNSVLASAFLLLVSNPYVIFDSGFLLSYSAVLFIVIFNRPLSEKFDPPNKVIKWVWNSITVTLTAQAGTAGLTVLLFNRFPAWFLISNLVIVPVSSAAIGAGALLTAILPLHFLSAILAKIFIFLLDLTLWFTEKAASLPMASITGIGFTWPEAILFTVLTGILASELFRREFRGLRLSLAALAVFSSFAVLTRIQLTVSEEVIVFNTSGCTTVVHRTGSRAAVYSTCDSIPVPVARYFAVRGIDASFYNTVGQNFILAGGQEKICILAAFRNSKQVPEDTKVIVMAGRYPDYGMLRKIKGTEEMTLVLPEVKKYNGSKTADPAGMFGNVVYTGISGALRIPVQ
jgi:competence protein ComEC